MLTSARSFVLLFNFQHIVASVGPRKKAEWHKSVLLFFHYIHWVHVYYLDKQPSGVEATTKKRFSSRLGLSTVFKRNLASNSSPPFTATASRVHKAVKKSKFNCDRMDLGIQHGWQLLKDFKQTSPTSSRSPFSIWFSFAFNELLFH